MYVLDEPSIGLHQRDNDRLLATLKHLRDLGNSVIVVEHDEDAIDVRRLRRRHGPGRRRARRAGRRAGHAGGHPARAAFADRPVPGGPAADSDSGAAASRRSGARADASPARRGNNLKNVTLRPAGRAVRLRDRRVGLGQVDAHQRHALPRGRAPPVRQRGRARAARRDRGPRAFRQGDQRRPEPDRTHAALESRDVHRACSRRSASCSRRCKEARERGYGPGRFSFNVKGGRCEACQGDGLIKVEMHFLPDVYVPCDVCHGQRYNRETLEIRYKGKNIHEVLAMTVEQAYRVLRAGAGGRAQARDAARRRPRLHHARPVGDHAVGRRSAAREARARAVQARHRAARCTSSTSRRPGLHFHDIELLLTVLHRLRDHGNTVVVIEHNLDVIKTADWIIDLGPEGGAGGGRDHRRRTAGGDRARRPRAIPGAI